MGQGFFFFRFDSFSLFLRTPQDLNTEILAPYQKKPSKTRGNNKICKDAWLVQNSNRFTESLLQLSYLLMLPKPPCPKEGHKLWNGSKPLAKEGKQKTNTGFLDGEEWQENECVLCAYFEPGVMVRWFSMACFNPIRKTLF